MKEDMQAPHDDAKAPKNQPSGKKNGGGERRQRDNAAAVSVTDAADRSVLRIGITHGDFNGIGYEVILKAFDDNRMLELCTPVVYGSAKIAAFYRKGLELQGTTVVQINEPAQARTDALNIINVIGQEAHISPGESTAEAGAAAFAALERAVADLRAGEIDLLVTAPINKHNIQSDLFSFPGHTEYLEASAGDGGKSLMILCNDTLRVALVTAHLPIAKVPDAITEDAIIDKIRIFEESLKKDFGIVKPRIAVLALNPHAGENGLLGAEEKDIIAPAISKAWERKIQAFGPYSADGFFGNDLYSKFDGVLAMYHDQGLAPFKTLSMENGVNFTAGLPIVRTSPDHGTGYDIAGKGKASEESMRAAIYMAIDIFRNRAIYDEMTANPLKKYYHEKGKDNVVLDLTKD